MTCVTKGLLCVFFKMASWLKALFGANNDLRYTTDSKFWKTVSKGSKASRPAMELTEGQKSSFIVNMTREIVYQLQLPQTILELHQLQDLLSSSNEAHPSTEQWKADKLSMVIDDVEDVLTEVTNAVVQQITKMNDVHSPVAIDSPYFDPDAVKGRVISLVIAIVSAKMQDLKIKWGWVGMLFAQYGRAVPPLLRGEGPLYRAG